MLAIEKLIEIADGLAQLDPLRDYPRRGAELVSQLVGATGYRLEINDGPSLSSDVAPAPTDPTLSLPLRNGRETFGTLHLRLRTGEVPGDRELQIMRWSTRMFARGLDYVERLAADNGRRADEDIAEALARMPLTPREKEVVALLVGGSGTRAIAEHTGLTVSTVNTYLKRIFSKLGVHSRVELVARMAGTDRLISVPPRRKSSVRIRASSPEKKASES